MHKTSCGIKYPRQTVHINPRVQADSACNSILFMRPRGINASLFSAQRIDLFYCLEDGTPTTGCIFFFGARKLRAKLWSICINQTQEAQEHDFVYISHPCFLFSLSYFLITPIFLVGLKKVFLCSMDFHNMSLFFFLPITGYL